MFEPHELELLICGNSVLDFEGLEQNTRYDDGYTKDSQTIKNFWAVVHSLDESEKKLFLKFFSGRYGMGWYRVVSYGVV